MQVPLYSFDLIIVQCKEVNDIFEKFMHKCYTFDAYMDFNNYPAFCIYNRHNVIIAYRDKKDLDAGIIAHESLHAAHHIFLEIGAIPDMNNDEPLCYLLGWIAQQFELFVNAEK